MVYWDGYMSTRQYLVDVLVTMVRLCALVTMVTAVSYRVSTCVVVCCRVLSCVGYRGKHLV